MDALLTKLNTLQADKSRDWVHNLEDRKKEELSFHDLDRDTEDTAAIEKQQELDMHANRKFYSLTRDSNVYVENWIAKNSKDKICLDYACGLGTTCIKSVELGAKLGIGVDISGLSIINARKFAADAGLKEKCFFYQGDCEATELPDNSVDTIFCLGMLHHLDLTKAFPEMQRILKPGGKVLAVEALAENPLIQYYRDKTPHMRTEWEKAHILGMKDLTYAKNFFEVGEVRFWHMLVIPAAFLHNTFLFKPVYSVLNLLDKVVLRIPGIQRWAWQFTFELIKK
jgi:ubiquinone/menaquinone biosynthesis C-methylase UbiE